MRVTSIIIIASLFFVVSERQRGRTYLLLSFPEAFPESFGIVPALLLRLTHRGFFAAVRDILTPDHTPVPCMDSFAPTASAKPSAAVFKVQKIGMIYGAIGLLIKSSRKKDHKI